MTAGEQVDRLIYVMSEIVTEGEVNGDINRKIQNISEF